MNSLMILGMLLFSLPAIIGVVYIVFYLYTCSIIAGLAITSMLLGLLFIGVAGF